MFVSMCEKVCLWLQFMDSLWVCMSAWVLGVIRVGVQFVVYRLLMNSLVVCTCFLRVKRLVGVNEVLLRSLEVCTSIMWSVNGSY